MSAPTNLSSASDTSSHNPLTLLELPVELLKAIFALLPNRHLKNVRLTCYRLYDNAVLRLDRVFISPCRKNIDVCRAIASHSSFRLQVTEIIWDYFRFERYLPRIEKVGIYYGDVADGKCFREYDNACIENELQFAGDEDRLARYAELYANVDKDNLMSVEESFELYRRLYDDQQYFIGSGEDVAMFQSCLTAFPALQRVTVTSEAYRPPYLCSHFGTPLIRSFPPGFSMPLPWPWLFTRDLSPFPPSLNNVYQRYRCYEIVISELLNHSATTHVSELIIDVNYEPTEISHEFFSRSPLYFLTTQLFKTGILRRFDLAINVCGTAEHNDWFCFGGNLLHNALRYLSPRLEHFSLHTCDTRKKSSLSTADERFPKLLSIIPIPSWPSLRSLTLSYLPTTISSLVSLLAVLRPTTKYLTFDTLKLLDSTWHSVLERFKSDLAWKRNHPTVTISIETEQPNRNHVLRDEVGDFLEGCRPNPFVAAAGKSVVKLGFGRIRDDFDDDVDERHEQAWTWAASHTGRG